MQLDKGTALVLENGFEMDIPEDLIEYLEDNNIKWKWYDMRQKFWPENKKSTVEFFDSLPIGQALYCHTTFVTYQQLELFIVLFHLLKHKKFKFYIMHGCLCDDLVKFYNEEESSITPKEIEKKLDANLSDTEYDEIYKEIYEFKKSINERFLTVLECHEIYWLPPYGTIESIRLPNLETIKENAYDK